MRVQRGFHSATISDVFTPVAFDIASFAFTAIAARSIGVLMPVSNVSTAVRMLAVTHPPTLSVPGGDAVPLGHALGGAACAAAQ